MFDIQDDRLLNRALGITKKSTPGPAKPKPEAKAGEKPANAKALRVAKYRRYLKTPKTI